MTVRLLLSRRVTIPACAYGAEPFSIHEIDAHPDKARIWATIRDLRDQVDVLTQEEYDRGYTEAAKDYAPGE